jgi:hypothetical protein
METVAFFYILLGLIIIGAAHIGKYGSTYIERVPVVLRMSSLKRWITNILNQSKNLNR